MGWFMAAVAWGVLWITDAAHGEPVVLDILNMAVALLNVGIGFLPTARAR